MPVSLLLELLAFRSFPLLSFHLTRVGVPFVHFTGHWKLTLNISPVTLTDMDHLCRKENNETTLASASLSPSMTKPRSPLARESLMASTFCDGNQDLPPLYWAEDGPSSPVQPLFIANYSARHTLELSPATSPPNTSPSSPRKDFGRLGAQRPSTGKDRDNFLSPYYPTGYPHKARFSAESLHKDADATYDSKADGVHHYEDLTEVGSEGDLDLEVDGLLDELMDYHSKRVTMASAPLLPLPEELSPKCGSTSPQLCFDSSLSPSVTGGMLFGGDSDTPSLVSSSPRSSKDLHFSPNKSPSLKSKKNFTPITPSTDGWRSPLATVPEHKTSSSDSFGHTTLSRHSATWSPGPRKISEDDTVDNYVNVLGESRRAHHTNLPPIRTVIPEDSFIQRRAKSSISSEQTIADDRRSRVESLADQSFSSHSSDGKAPEITETGYPGPGFGRMYLSNSSEASIRFAQPGFESPHKPWSGALYSPSSSIGPGSVDYPSPTKLCHAPSPKRGMFQSLFSQNGSFEQKKERKWSKMRDPINIQSSSMDSVSPATASKKSSKDKGKGKAERRAQLAAQLKARQLQEPTEKDRGASSRATVPGKVSAGWEERGGMWSIDSFI